MLVINSNRENIYTQSMHYLSQTDALLTCEKPSLAWEQPHKLLGRADHDHNIMYVKKEKKRESN